MAPYDPLQRVTPRPERPHMPFEIGHRHGPLFRSALVVGAIAGGALVGLTIGAAMLGVFGILSGGR